MRVRFFLAMLMLLPRAIAAEGIVFPQDAGVLSVKDFGAKGDGRHDDTAAIQKLLADRPDVGRIIYLPNGTYRISDSLLWPQSSQAGSEPKNTILQGQSREKTILRLADASPGFADPNVAKPVIWTGHGPAGRFRNAVRDLTIDTGKKNPGSIGVQFMANNQGCIRDVTIRSGDGQGRIGLDMAFSDEIGPLFVRNVRIAGFDYGIRTAHSVNGMTFEHITLENQNRFGFVNEGQCVSIRDLTSRGAVPALVNADGPGLVTLVDANLTTLRGVTPKPAVLNEATLFARKVSTSGFREALRDTSGEARPQGKKVAMFVSRPILSLFSSPARSLDLPVRETPDVPWDDPRTWASPTHCGAKPDDDQDDTRAIQAAIDSGKTTVYFPRGRYHVRDTVLVRKNVRRLIGCEAHIELADLGQKPGFKLIEGTAPVFVFERILGGSAQTPTLENASPRTLVIRDCCNVSGRMTGPGDVFLEDVCSNPSSDWRFGRQNIWARQLDVENEGTHIRNDGGTLWILGLTTVRGGTLIETTAGGKTEVLGGLCRTTTAGANLAPMFLSRESSLSVVFGEACFHGEPYSTLVSETRGGITKTAKKGDTPARTRGSVIPLFTGFGR